MSSTSLTARSASRSSSGKELRGSLTILPPLGGNNDITMRFLDRASEIRCKKEANRQ